MWRTVKCKSARRTRCFVVVCSLEVRVQRPKKNICRKRVGDRQIRKSETFLWNLREKTERRVLLLCAKRYVLWIRRRCLIRTFYKKMRKLSRPLLVSTPPRRTSCNHRTKFDLNAIYPCYLVNSHFFFFFCRTRNKLVIPNITLITFFESTVVYTYETSAHRVLKIYRPTEVVPPP